MKRIISGIPFIIHSPSHYEVAVRDDGSDIEAAHLCYTGHGKWMLRVWLKPNGLLPSRSITRDFPSLDAALELLSSRRAA